MGRKPPLPGRVNKPFVGVCATGFKLPHSHPGPDPLRAKSKGDCDRRTGAVRRLSGCVLARAPSQAGEAPYCGGGPLELTLLCFPQIM